jgi:hypothetical protein
VVASRHNRSLSGMSPPLWRQVERKMVVTEAPVSLRLWSSLLCSVVDMEPAVRCLMRNPSASGILVSRHPKVNPDRWQNPRGGGDLAALGNWRQ